MRFFLVGAVALLLHCESPGHDDFIACGEMCRASGLKVWQFKWREPGQYTCTCDFTSEQPGPTQAAPPAGP